MVAPDQIDGLRMDVFRGFHHSHRGSHGRLDWWVDFASGRWNYETQQPDRRVRSAIHRDRQGRPDGVVSYRIAEDHGSTMTMTVDDFIAENADAELGLWEFLASVDLVTTVKASKVNPETPLPWALRDPRVVRFTRRSDLTWVRILDVAAALRARGWDHAGSVALHVIDPLEWCTGTYRIDVAAPGETAEVARVEDAAAATIGIAALGSLYFGGVGARALAGAGQLRGTAEQVQEIGRLFATDDLPHCISAF
jgi:predicted acetyltransferase